MTNLTRRFVGTLAATLTALELLAWTIAIVAQQPSTLRPPAFQIDPTWPTIPNNWVLGEVSSIAVDSRDQFGAASPAIDSRGSTR
jgi:hypothetical protein